jgi:hypothetical protein
MRTSTLEHIEVLWIFKIFLLTKPPHVVKACIDIFAIFFLHYIKFIIEFKLVILCCLISLWNYLITFFFKKPICLKTDENPIDQWLTFSLENYRELFNYFGEHW